MAKSAMRSDGGATAPTTRHVLGGIEMNMQDYASYIEMLSHKPFLSKREASELFGVGINRISELMRDPDCPFASAGEGRGRKVHRERFEAYLLTHDVYEEV